jgi:hypothetical protein
MFYLYQPLSELFSFFLTPSSSHLQERLHIISPPDLFLNIKVDRLLDQLRIASKSSLGCQEMQDTPMIIRQFNGRPHCFSSFFQSKALQYSNAFDIKYSFHVKGFRRSNQIYQRFRPAFAEAATRRQA